MTETVKLFNGKSIPRTEYEDALEYMNDSKLWQAYRTLLDYCGELHSWNVNKLADNVLRAITEAIDAERDYATLVEVHVTQTLKTIKD